MEAAIGPATSTFAKLTQEVPIHFRRFELAFQFAKSIQRFEQIALSSLPACLNMIFILRNLFKAPDALFFLFANLHHVFVKIQTGSHIVHIYCFF